MAAQRQGDVPKHDPGDAVPDGVPGSTAGDDGGGRPKRDPGDAVPPGVAPLEPAPLTEADRQAKKQLEELPKRRD